MVEDQVTAGAWWEIWTAGVALYTLCIQRGKAGYATGLGKSIPRSGLVIRDCVKDCLLIHRLGQRESIYILLSSRVEDLQIHGV